MIDLFFIPVAALYLLVVGMLFAYGVNFFYLTSQVYRSRNKENAHTSQSQKMDIEEWPAVTIQLPIYNERYVAARLIQAAGSITYPQECLEIQVLDDSSDDTTEIVQREVARLRSRGLNIHHLHRKERLGYKAGALNEGFELASGEFIAVFDADFVPQKDFLKQIIPKFQDEQVAFVQARWSHINTDYSLLTMLQSLSIDAHFIVEQYARYQKKYWFNFNGTAGVWRRAAIQDAGGWKAETLTEDLDLSYRAFLRGWKASFDRDIEVPAELPVSFNAYRRQQHRWARGSLECAIKFLPLIWDAPVKLPQKIQATLHLTGYFVHILLFALTLLYPLVLFLSRDYPAIVGLFGIAFLFNATAFAPTIFFAVAQQQQGKRWLRRLPLILFMTILGSGMMLNTVRAALQILSGKKRIFERTPKYGIERKKQAWKNTHYNLKLDSLVTFELPYAFFNLWTVGFAIQQGNWMIGVYAGIFALGLFFTSGFTIAQALAHHRGAENRGASPGPIQERITTK